MAAILLLILDEGGVYLRVAAILLLILDEGGVYSRAATTQGRHQLEEIQ